MRRYLIRTKAKAKAGARWPRDRLDSTKRYRAERDGLIYEVAPVKGRPGYWRAAVKRRNRLVKRTEQPLREAGLLMLFRSRFFPWGIQLWAVNDRNARGS
jgi:hypothetical protein